MLKKKQQKNHTNGRAFLLPHSHLVPILSSRAGQRETKTKLPTFLPNALYNLRAAGWGITARLSMVDAIISQPFEASARNICCHYHMWLWQQRPPAEDRTLCPPPSLCHCQRAGSGERGWRPSPLGPISHIGFSALINWLHLPHIWQERFLITLWSLQRTWITGMRGALVTSPHSLLLKVPHISRGQALAWAGAESRTRAMASRHCHGAQRFSLRGRTDNFEPRQCAAFFSCQSYLVCI